MGTKIMEGAKVGDKFITRGGRTVEILRISDSGWDKWPYKYMGEQIDMISCDEYGIYYADHRTHSANDLVQKVGNFVEDTAKTLNGDVIRVGDEVTRRDGSIATIERIQGKGIFAVTCDHGSTYDCTGRFDPTEPNCEYDLMSRVKKYTTVNGEELRVGDKVRLRGGDYAFIVDFIPALYGDIVLRFADSKSWFNCYNHGRYLHYSDNTWDIVSIIKEEAKTMAKTIEGYDIKEGEAYTTRDGKKAIAIKVDTRNYFTVDGVIINSTQSRSWRRDGTNPSSSSDDLMRPWGTEPKKVYNISETYRLFFKQNVGTSYESIAGTSFETREAALAYTKLHPQYKFIALLKSDQALHTAKFFEGEGL